MGHQLLPEWTTQSGVIITWPHDISHWGDQYQALERTYVLLVENISRFEDVYIACLDHEHKDHISGLIKSIERVNIFFYTIKSNDIWVRDYGPISLLDNNIPVSLNFQFDGWGKKYPCKHDNRFTPLLYQMDIFRDIELHYSDFILEGGSIEYDGSGTLLTTKSCLVDHNRNPGYSMNDIRHYLIRLFGINRVIFLNHGYLLGDDTDGHIDMLARFCNQNTIAYAACDNPDDEHYGELQAMAEELSKIKTLDNIPYHLVPLPIPGIKLNSQGERLPASYCNFLVINKAVLVPTYDDIYDELALTRLQECFPGREIIGIDSLSLISQFGGLHCATMQVAIG